MVERFKAGLSCVANVTFYKWLNNSYAAEIVLLEDIGTSPLTVEYALTPLGRTLVEPLSLLCQWSINYYQEVEKARAQSMI